MSERDTFRKYLRGLGNLEGVFSGSMETLESSFSTQLLFGIFSPNRRAEKGITVEGEFNRFEGGV